MLSKGWVGRKALIVACDHWSLSVGNGNSGGIEGRV